MLDKRKDRCWILDKSHKQPLSSITVSSIKHPASRILNMRCGDFKETYLQDEAIFQSLFVKLCLALFFVFLLIFPFLANCLLFIHSQHDRFRRHRGRGLKSVDRIYRADFFGTFGFHRGGGLYLGHPDHPLRLLLLGSLSPLPDWFRPWPA